MSDDNHQPAPQWSADDIRIMAETMLRIMDSHMQPIFRAPTEREVRYEASHPYVLAPDHNHSRKGKSIGDEYRLENG